MTTLKAMLGVAPHREQLIREACEVLDLEVKDKGGLGGAAIKAAYGVVKGISPAFVRDVVDNLLDDFLDALNPIHDEAKAQGAPVGKHLEANAGQLAESLLAITDGRAARAQRAVIKKTYERLRPTAKKHVEAAAPRLGALLERAISRT